MLDSNKRETEVCPSCGAVAIEGNIGYCLRCGRRYVAKKDERLHTAIIFPVGIAALISSFFGMLGILASVLLLAAEGAAVNKVNLYNPLIWLGISFGLISVLRLIFYAATELYFILQAIM